MSITKDKQRTDKVGKKYKGVYLYDKEAPKETLVKSKDPQKVHVSLYLKTKDVKIWERGGMAAFAKVKGKEFATEKELDDLFLSY